MSSYLTPRDVSLDIVSSVIYSASKTTDLLGEAAQSEEELPVAFVIKAELEAVEVMFVWQVKSLSIIIIIMCTTLVY